jgi:4a-hydroxytetrahydrobiopterin dehydratase
MKLSDSDVAARLKDLPQWTLAGGKLHREYKFADFVAAFGFMASCALVAERMNHHPEWFNVYSKVVVDLATHDVGGISAKDFELAAAMDKLA